MVAAGALLTTSVVIAIAPRIWAVANAHSEDPVVLPAFNALAQRTYVYDSAGNEIAVYELENSQPIDYEDIPEHVVRAFLTVEDKEFFSHDGINVRSLFRATLSNFASDAPQQGASTITMQVVKNDFLAGLERDGRYKLLQIHYARMLEKELGKEAIMERYLNTVFFGNNSYGIQAAAETYYGKTAAELTFVEAAFLAGLVRSPSGFDPINEPERSRARWLQVIDALVSQNAYDENLVPITPARGRIIEDEFAIPSRIKSVPTRATERTYYTEALRDFLLNRSDILGADYQERYNQLFRGGLRIHTTLDPVAQQAAEVARRDRLPDTQGRFDAALVSLDVKSGAIRAMVGGAGFKPNEREINMALSPRQTGSSIKYFILAAAVQAGAQAGDTIDGRRGCRLPNEGNLEEPFFEINGGVAGFVGDLRQITASSINCGFARLSQIVGLNRVVDTTYRMAESPYLYAGQPESERLPIKPFASFATGANEMTVLDMASGIQSIANDGLHKDPFYVEYIDRADGSRMYTHFDVGTRVLDVDAARETVSIMKGTILGGTGRSARLEGGRPAFGKTGTQQEDTDAWFVGGTTELATAVWVGDPDAYTPMVNIREFQQAGVPKVQGGTFPAAIWKSFMDGALAGEPIEDFVDPAPPERPNARLVLPGNECSVTVVGYNETVVAVGPAPTAATVPVETVEGEEPVETAAPQQQYRVDRTPITVQDALGTTIAPDVLDPDAPLPSVPANQQVSACR